MDLNYRRRERPLNGDQLRVANDRVWPRADELARTAAVNPLLSFMSGSFEGARSNELSH
jgi:hypothetical protein